ncbi:type IV pilus assembly protein PilA [Catenuloplanes nepalensis]|uniref:Type IV pilus assembly protein PilA n=1 Tax=Catenuloplanes nepalensis TaxID=587533 RepID=A0ABT9MWP1_9ACTN|nr:prepilin-type N-terminal cleavage/methylation domain-containing protein [Catenuloplanes nepalensis]MDP9795648.1 type IV pilus assembly protein PilA [Catenuloplanes nepalensis]
MQHLIAKSQRKRAESDKGFTLIELLVVVVIIGILVAIAVPVYLNYRKGASNKSAQSDVRAAISAVETFYTENGNKYPDSAAAVTAPTALTLNITGGTSPQKATLSDGNTLRYERKTATTYVICGFNADGQKYFVYDNSVGGSVKQSAATTMDACITNSAVTTPATT